MHMLGVNPLDKYDGTSVPLETFLAKFHNCVRFNGWSVEERSAFLRDSLNGAASHVLWEISDSATDEDIIKLLRNRFGNANMMERYRAELHGRRRKRGESVQSVYQDIRRLMSLAFPGHSGELFETIGRDAFLQSLNDPALRVRVLDQHPQTLDEALTIVTRMEAYSESIHMDEDNSDKKRVRVVSPVRETDADRRIRKLEELVAGQKCEIAQLRGTVVNSGLQQVACGRVNSGIPGQSGKPGHPDAETPRVSYALLMLNFTYVFFSTNCAKFSDVSMVA